MKSYSFKMTFFSKLILLGIFITTSVFALGSDPPEHKIAVVSVTNDQLTYVVYDINSKQTLDLSDLILSEQITKSGTIPSQLNFNWSELPDFKLLLLQAGLAKLKNPEISDEKYRNAQEKAQAENKGIWSKPPSPQPQSPSPIQTPNNGPTFWEGVGQSLTSIGNFLWNWINLLAPIGIIGVLLTFLSTYFYKRFYIQRRIRLMFLGEPSSGKTALYCRILDPKIDKQKVLELTPTEAFKFYKMKKHISHGRFEIYPQLKDISGSAFSTVWDEFTGSYFTRSHALVVVLSTTKMNSKDTNIVTDEKYLYMQLGYIQAFIEGAMGARKTNKPKVVILFLNKFDLYAAYPPTDSAVIETRDMFRKLFEEHIRSAELALKKANIPCHIILGSALENWNCELIVEIIGKELYGT